MFFDAGDAVGGRGKWSREGAMSAKEDAKEHRRKMAERSSTSATPGP
jgi:hypothetical protein